MIAHDIVEGVFESIPLLILLLILLILLLILLALLLVQKYKYWRSSICGEGVLESIAREVNGALDGVVEALVDSEIQEWKRSRP
jgi:biopolymer transport protein ExbB/TolQ